MASEIKEARAQMQSQELKMRQKEEKWALEREELQRNLLKVTTKETQYKHEIKSRDMQIEKLKDGFR